LSLRFGSNHNHLEFGWRPQEGRDNSEDTSKWAGGTTLFQAAPYPLPGPPATPGCGQHLLPGVGTFMPIGATVDDDVLHHRGTRSAQRTHRNGLITEKTCLRFAEGRRKFRCLSHAIQLLPDFIICTIFSGRVRSRSLQPQPTAARLSLCRQRHIHHLAHLPLLAMGGYYHRPKARIVEGDGSSRRAVQQMQRHAVAPDGSAALHDHQRAARDVGQRGQRLGGGDGRGDGDGVDDGGGHFFSSDLFLIYLQQIW
jgi:hypothetical protein